MTVYLVLRILRAKQTINVPHFYQPVNNFRECDLIKWVGNVQTEMVDEGILFYRFYLTVIYFLCG